MAIQISFEIVKQIHSFLEAAYPDEGAGLLLGEDKDGQRRVLVVLPLTNSRESDARRNRYLITAQDMLHGELEAVRLGLDVVGIFHSHPDSPNRPSEFDREWALPWFSYLITTVNDGLAQSSRSWRLQDDRSQFKEELVAVIPEQMKS
jgi:proteasome lid subunit RPN8/RPN11